MGLTMNTPGTMQYKNRVLKSLALNLSYSERPGCSSWYFVYPSKSYWKDLIVQAYISKHGVLTHIWLSSGSSYREART